MNFPQIIRDRIPACGRMTGIDSHFRKNIGDPHGDPADGQRIIKSVFLQIL